ncbi:hypothetical protein ACIRPK_29775 [Kitasatospora sp. NPDC101801]|uniref:hypothetical protein n=1 Tax=Kitasatospora sp. NPDC101801 TaxID=3364103 RepID=UPI0038297BAC
MNLKRSAAALLGAVALAPVLLAGAGAAQAAPVAQAAAVQIAAGSPSVSPSVTPRTFSYDTNMLAIYCPSGSLCVAVDDPGAQKWRVFDFDPCRTYSVYNWEGGGYYINNQTGPNATAVFYGTNGNVSAPIGTRAGINLHPINSLRNCW